MQTDFELIPEPDYPYANDDLWNSLELNYPKGIERAIQDGADLNYQKDGMSPLQMVVQGNNILLVTFLLEHGANPNTRDVESNRSMLMEATSRGYVEIAKLLLEYGAKPYGWDNQGYTPLGIAVGYNRVEIVKLLLEYEADPNEKILDKKTVLEYAEEYPNNKKKIVKLLKDHINKANKQLDKKEL